MTMSAAVYEVLQHLLAPGAAERKAAEANLSRLQQQPDFSVTVFQLSRRSDLPIEHKQMAVLILKNYVECYWSSAAEKFVGPEPPEDVKLAFRAQIVEALNEPACVIARIAHYDWPEMWPEFSTIILNKIRSENSNVVDGAVYVLSDFMRDDITDQTFPDIAPVLFRELLHVLMYSDKLSTKLQALSVYRDGLELLQMMASKYPDACKGFIDQMLPQWLPAFRSIIEHAGTDSKSKALLLLSSDICRALNQLIEQFGSMIPTLVEFLQPVLALTNKLVFIHSQDDSGEGILLDDLDDLVESFRPESCLYAVFELLTSLCGVKNIKPVVFQQGNPFLNSILCATLKAMEMTEDQKESYEQDANQFIAEEDETSFSLSVRLIADQLLSSLVSREKRETLSTLCQIIQEIMNKASQDDENWWKPIEASLYCLGRLSDDIIDGVQEGWLQFPLNDMFVHVINNLVNSNVSFLRGRALWFSSRFTGYIPHDLAQRYCHEAILALQNSSESIPVRVSSIKALQHFAEAADTSSIARYVDIIVKSLADLAPMTSEEALVLILETLHLVCKIDVEKSSQQAPLLVQLILHVWTANPTDHIVGSIVEDLVCDIASNARVFEELTMKAVPILMEAVSTKDWNVSGSLIASCVDLINAMIRSGPSPIPQPMLSLTYLPIMKLLITQEMEDANVLQSGQMFAKHVVAKSMFQLAQWKVEADQSALDVLLRFVQRLLDPTRTTESGALFVGDLVWKLVRVGDHVLAPILPALVEAVVQRLESTKGSSVSQYLIAALSQLFLADTQGLLDLLSRITVNGRSGVDIVFNNWADNAEYFHGHFVIKLTSVALTKLLLLQDKRLLETQVKDEQIIDENERGIIITRSKAKSKPIQWSYCSFQMKAVNILVKQLHEDDADEAMTKGISADSSFNVDEWEDYEDEESMLQKFADEDDDEYEEEEDLDLKNDPLYTLKLSQFLVEFFRGLSQTQPGILNTLKPQEQQVLVQKLRK